MPVEVLGEITSQVHDLYFDVDALEVIEGEVRIPLLRGRVRRGRVLVRVRPPAGEDTAAPVGTLVIRSVRSLAVDDEAQVGWCAIDRVVADTRTMTVRVECHLPVEVALSVGVVDVELVA